jgi:hypothetical protein
MGFEPFREALRTVPSGRTRGRSSSPRGLQAAVDETQLAAGAAWQIAQLEEGAGSLRAARLLLCPAYLVVYSHLGYPLSAWVCGTSGAASGISHLTFWNNAALREQVERSGRSALQEAGVIMNRADPQTQGALVNAAVNSMRQGEAVPEDGDCCFYSSFCL